MSIVTTGDQERFIERSARTDKECIRHVVKNMPFGCVPLLMVKRLVQVAIRNSNQFLLKNRVSGTCSVLAAVTKSLPLDHANFNIAFGAHAEVFE